MPDSNNVGNPESDPEETAGRAQSRAAGGSVRANPAEFSELAGARTGVSGSLGHLLEVKFDVEAVLGRTVLPIENILELGTGSIVELDRLISETVDLVIQGVNVTRGEVVVVDDRFAIRIKEIINPVK